jgi:GT2 family glycosyltransferase
MKDQVLNNNMTISDPLVSVVIPTYNRSDKLLRLIGSIQDQILPDDLRIEILVVDNASTDNTVGLLKETYPSTQVIKLDRNYMSSYAREAGINASRGKYIFIVDDDNILDNRCIHTLVDKIQSDKSIGMVAPLMLKYHKKNEVWCAGAKLTRFYFPRYDFVHQPISNLPNAELLCGSDYFPNAFMVRRSILQKHTIRNRHKIFPHNWGETDFGLQIKNASYKLCTALQAITYHDIGYERMGITRISVPNAYDQARSRMLFFRIHQTDILNRLAWIFLFFPYMLIFYMRRFLKQKNTFALWKSYTKGLWSGIISPISDR